MKQLLQVAVAATLEFTATAALAHHSAAMFDQSKQITLSGTVRDFQWTSPHCYIQLLANTDQGAPQEWSLEMAAPMYLPARRSAPQVLPG